jgi:hypothetical protein
MILSLSMLNPCIIINHISVPAGALLILDKNLKTQSLLQHITSKTLQMFSLKISLKAG